MPGWDGRRSCAFTGQVVPRSLHSPMLPLLWRALPHREQRSFLNREARYSMSVKYALTSVDVEYHERDTREF